VDVDGQDGFSEELFTLFTSPTLVSRDFKKFTISFVAISISSELRNLLLNLGSTHRKISFYY